MSDVNGMNCSVLTGINKEKNMKRSIVCAILAAVVLAVVIPSASYASPVYLVGAQLSETSDTGAWGVSNWIWTTNSYGGDAKFGAFGGGAGTAVSVALADGNNTVNYSLASAYNPFDYTNMSLFFNTTGVSFNTSQADWTAQNPVSGDLIVTAPVNGSGFTVPAAGTRVLSYASYGGDYLIAGVANGNTSFIVGEGADARKVTVTGFESKGQGGPLGTLTINVAPVPEPVTMATLGMGGLAALIRRRK